MKEPNVRVLAQKLCQCLQRAVRGDDPARAAAEAAVARS